MQVLTTALHLPTGTMAQHLSFLTAVLACKCSPRRSISSYLPTGTMARHRALRADGDARVGASNPRQVTDGL